MNCGILVAIFGISLFLQAWCNQRAIDRLESKVDKVMRYVRSMRGLNR